MALEFKPKSEQEIREAQLAPDGDYDFEVMKAEDTVSKKSGNGMIKLTIGLYRGEAIRHYVIDYLVSAMEAKLRHFADTTGLLARYESGQLCAADCTGRAGRCRIVIEEDKAGNYPDKNSVRDYIVRTAKPLAGAKSPAPAAPKPTYDGPPLENDDVPF